MTREQAEKLYDMCDGEKTFPHYTASPYVAGGDSGVIQEIGGKFMYRDDALVEVDVEEADVSDFVVFRRKRKWWK